MGRLTKGHYIVQGGFNYLYNNTTVGRLTKGHCIVQGGP